MTRAAALLGLLLALAGCTSPPVPSPVAGYVVPRCPDADGREPVAEYGSNRGGCPR